MMNRGRSQPEDELLVLECQAGIETAFAQLASRWHSRLLYRAMSLMGNVDEAQEVAQEGWLAIARGIRSLKDPARFGSWSYRIIQNKAADRIRANQRRRGMRVDSDLDLAPTLPPDTDGTHLPAVPALWAAIRRLSAEHRRTIELFYLEEMSIAEIARLTQVPPGTVKSRLFHARESLRRTLEESR